MPFAAPLKHPHPCGGRLTKRLRAEKTLKEQAHARAQDLSFQLAAGPTSGGAPDGGLHPNSHASQLQRPNHASHAAAPPSDLPNAAGGRAPPALFRAQPAHGSSAVFASRRKPGSAAP